MNKKLHNFFMNTAKNLAEISSCVSHKVGCIIVKNNRIISMGYNGTPSGYHIKCCDKFDSKNWNKEEHHKWSNIHEIHAEVNALVNAANNNISIDNSIMYCTLFPCDNCLKMISQSGINELYYLNEYNRSSEKGELFEFISSKIKIEKFIEAK